MKKQQSQTRRSRHRSRRGLPSRREFAPTRFVGNLESLETRNLLAANPLASIDNSINDPGGSNEVQLIVGLPDASASSSATLMMSTTSFNGLDPAAPRIFDSSGTPVSATRMDDTFGSGGMTVAALGPGEYTLIIDAEGASSGGYQLDVSLVGDVETADSRVGLFEKQLASAAVVQFLGTGNFVTDQFYMSLGIDMGISQYDLGMDANVSGAIEPSDLAVIEAHERIGRVSVELIPDANPPVFDNVRLANDTGVSSSDRISTDVTILGEVLDESLITEVLAGIDGAPSFDITSLVNGNGSSFTLTPDTLASIAGGTLSDGPHVLQLSGTDELGNVTDPPFPFSFTLITNNQAPAGVIPDQSATEDAAFQISAATFLTDSNPGDVLIFTDGNLPDWLSLDGATGFLSGTPTNDDVGSSDVTITATDSQGLSASSTFALTVINTNDDPIINPIPDATAEDDVFFSIDIGSQVSDPDVGDVVTISVDRSDGGIPAPLPAWLSFDPSTGILGGTPTDADLGVVPILVQAIDQSTGSASQEFTITVADQNDDPILIQPIPDQTATEGSAFSLDLSSFFDDPDQGDTLSFSGTLGTGTALPGWLNLFSITGILSGTPLDADVGTIVIEARATDTFGASVTDTFNLTVEDINNAPVINNQSFRVSPLATNGTVVGTVVATDADTNDTLTFSASGPGASFLAINPITGVITVSDATQLVDGADVALNVNVTDSGAPPLSADAVMSIRVSDNDDPTAVDDDGFTVRDDKMLEIAAGDLLGNDTDPDGDTLTVAAVVTSARGATVTLNVDGSVVTYDPSSSSELLSLSTGQQLVDTFDYAVSDGNGGTDTAMVSVIVTGQDVVQFRLTTVDSTGVEISEIAPGGEFELMVFVQDIRPEAERTGAFSAHLNVEFPVGDAIVNGAIDHLDTYNSAQNGDTLTPGLINGAGGLDGLSPLGGDEFALFSIPFLAGPTPGTVTFTGGAVAEELRVLRAVNLFGESADLQVEQVIYGTTSITITGVQAPLSGNGIALTTNQDDPLDVNDDGEISPLDALLLVNYLNDPGGVGGGELYLDVNGDGQATPLDALLVINGVNDQESVPQAPLSSSFELTSADVGSVAVNLASSTGVPTSTGDARDAVFGSFGTASAVADLLATDQSGEDEDADEEATEEALQQFLADSGLVS